jgi:ubiquinone/menaquinone biosynthesis C-methylase UbiE
MNTKPQQVEYVLGSEPSELERLDRQADRLEAATRLLLGRAGITRGMRVLDLGTGLGHVARIVGDLVGPTGTVVGVDREAGALAIARQRSEAAGVRHVSFVDGDVAQWRSTKPFDAITGRLVLFHLPDPVLAVRQQLPNLRPEGLFVALDYDTGATRAEPPVALVAEMVGWIERAFVAAGAWPRIGCRLGSILTQAGLANVATIGIQGYLPALDPVATALLAGVVRSLSDAMMRDGIATAEEIGVDTLEQRIEEALRRADAVLLPPTLVGAWGLRSRGDLR